jgi:hypothetical protein
MKPTPSSSGEISALTEAPGKPAPKTLLGTSRHRCAPAIASL